MISMLFIDITSSIAKREALNKLNQVSSPDRDRGKDLWW